MKREVYYKGEILDIVFDGSDIAVAVENFKIISVPAPDVDHDVIWRIMDDVVCLIERYSEKDTSFMSTMEIVEKFLFSRVEKLSYSYSF
jgi:hypothetical protein